MASQKRKLHHVLKLIQKINSFVLLTLCIIFAVICVLALRDNNHKMVELRAAVFKADQDNGDIEGALTSLRTFVYAHMNTNLSSGANAVKPPIQLKYTYERLSAANNATYKAEVAKVLKDAEDTCIAQYPGTVYSQPRSNCAKAYGEAHPVTLKTVPEDLYKFDFLSPRWSPDKAGWSMLATGFFFILFALRLLSTWAIKKELQKQG